MAGEVQAAADLMKTLFGERRTGGIAPPHEAGQGGMLPPSIPPLGGFASGDGFKSVEEMLGLTPQQPAQLPIGQANTQQGIGGNADILARGGDLSGGFGTGNLPSDEGILAGIDPRMVGEQQGPTDEEMGRYEKPENPFSQFFSRLDQNMQSPSRVIGMGLLGQIHPALGYGALGAMGLLGGKR